MRNQLLALSALALATGWAGGCARADESASAETAPPAEQPTEPAPRRVEILAPLEGETVQGPDITVRLAAHEFLVVPAGDTTANSGHHHVFLDRDLSPTGAPIPGNEPGRLVHMGNGASEVVLQGIAPGPHRLITMVGNAGHVPLEPLVVDTVNFVVR
jgi:hypothetical protein